MGKIEMLFCIQQRAARARGGAWVTYAISTFGATTLDVNEQNEQAVGFYLRLGFRIIGRSERDSSDKPYPLLHLQLARVADILPTDG